MHSIVVHALNSVTCTILYTEKNTSLFHHPLTSHGDTQRLGLFFDLGDKLITD